MKSFERLELAFIKHLPLYLVYTRHSLNAGEQYYPEVSNTYSMT